MSFQIARSLLFFAATTSVLLDSTNAPSDDSAGQENGAYTDPATGVEVRRLVSGEHDDEVVYYTHPMWTPHMEHFLFDSTRTGGRKQLHAMRMADGAIRCIATVSSGSGVLSRKSSRLYYLDDREIIVTNVKAAFEGIRQREVLADLPVSVQGLSGGMSLDADEETLYIGAKMKSPERWTLMALNLKQRTWVTTTTVHFRIGHVQANPFETGCIMFCHETGGFATQRTWLIPNGEAAPRPMYKAPHDYWVTHESWWKKNEIIFTVWPFDATHKRLPHGIFSALAESGEAKEYARYPAWHTHASPDGRWIVGDDFQRNIWLIRADSRQRRLLSHGHLSDGHKTHPHPSFTPDSQSVVFNSSRDGHPDIFMIAIPSDLENLPKP